MNIGEATTLFHRYGNVGRSADDLITGPPTEEQLQAAANVVRRNLELACDTIRRFHDMPEPGENKYGAVFKAELKPPGCGKNGCHNEGNNRVVGSLTYHACDGHLDEISELVAHE